MGLVSTLEVDSQTQRKLRLPPFFEQNCNLAFYRVYHCKQDAKGSNIVLDLAEIGSFSINDGNGNDNAIN